MQTYTVKFEPHETAPPGELGRADFFGFIVTAHDEIAAAHVAQDKFNAAFGEDFTRHYFVARVD